MGPPLFLLIVVFPCGKMDNYRHSLIALDFSEHGLMSSGKQSSSGRFLSKLAVFMYWINPHARYRLGTIFL